MKLDEKRVKIVLESLMSETMSKHEHLAESVRLCRVQVLHAHAEI